MIEDIMSAAKSAVVAAGSALSYFLIALLVIVLTRFVYRLIKRSISSAGGPAKTERELAEYHFHNKRQRKAKAIRRERRGFDRYGL